MSSFLLPRPSVPAPFCGFGTDCRLCVLLFISAPCTTQWRPELEVVRFRCSSAGSFLSLLLITTAHLASLPVALLHRSRVATGSGVGLEMSLPHFLGLCVIDCLCYPPPPSRTPPPLPQHHPPVQTGRGGDDASDGDDLPLDPDSSKSRLLIKTETKLLKNFKVT